MAFFDLGFLTQMPVGMKAKVYNNVTRQMKWRTNESITNVFCKLKMEVSPISFFD